LTLDAVTRSASSYSGDDLTGLVHTDPADAVLCEYDWTVVDGRITAEFQIP